MFEALAAAKITSVTADFDGEGDSGQINDTIAYAGENQIPLPSTSINIHSAQYGVAKITKESQTIADAITDLCYGYLEQEHGGWENNEGAYGEFTLKVAERTISLEFHSRFTDIETFNHSF